LKKLTETNFNAAVEEARKKLPGLGTQFIDRLGGILQQRQKVEEEVGRVGTGVVQTGKKLTSLAQLGQPVATTSSNPLANELAELMPARFLEQISFARLTHLPRYLKALLIRAERAALNPAKDQERAKQLAPYASVLKRFHFGGAPSRQLLALMDEFRWMVEEYKVSLFAQELGTAAPVSPKRLDQQLELLKQSGARW
jgi:ATP-dependent helicase HrpA